MAGTLRFLLFRKRPADDGSAVGQFLNNVVRKWSPEDNFVRAILLIGHRLKR